MGPDGRGDACRPAPAVVAAFRLRSIVKAGNCPYRSPDDLPATIPVFPLPAALLLPRSELPLNIFEPRYVAMIDAALASDRIVGMIQPDEGKGPCALGPSLCKVGCAGRITSLAETGD